jgi:serine/threonine protein phosphatase PrpC
MDKLNYFAATYTDFIKFDRKPNEDFYLISEILPIFAIADGVTQSHFREGKFKGEYAFPAGAKVAAQIFCYTTLEFLEKNLPKQNKNFENLIKEAFNLANQKIKEFNISEGIDKKLDYFEYDWFDTVGITGFIVENTLYFGYVGDCGLAIFDKENKLKFQTKDQVAEAKKFVKKLYKNWKNFSFYKKTLILRKELRNRPDGRGFGSFTGQEYVKKYYQIGKQNLREGDLVLFYSDGFLNYLKFPKFIKILRKMVRQAHHKQDKKALDKFTFQKAKKSYRKYGTDRTLIAVNFSNLPNF